MHDIMPASYRKGGNDMHFLTPEEMKVKRARQKLLLSGSLVLFFILLFSGLTFFTYQF
jgi:hypothetical protein